MSKIGLLAGKGKKFQIGKGENAIELEIKPLAVADMDLMMKLGNEETQQEATNEVINKVLKQACPDATDEEIAGISVEHLQDLMEAIMEANGMNTKEGNTQFLAEIKKKQSGK